MNAKRKSRPALDVLEDLSFIYSTSPDQFIESNQQFFLSALLANPQVLSFSVRKNLLKMVSRYFHTSSFGIAHLFPISMFVS